MNEPLGIALDAAIRRLEFGGYLYRAPAWYEQKPRPVLRPTRRILSALGGNVSKVIESVSAAFGISIWAILSEKRPARTCRARFAVYRILSERLAYSTPKIARATRRKDHTTVLHGLKRAKELMANDPAWAAAYFAAEHALDSK